MPPRLDDDFASPDSPDHRSSQERIRAPDDPAPLHDAKTVVSPTQDTMTPIIGRMGLEAVGEMPS